MPALFARRDESVNLILPVFFIGLSVADLKFNLMPGPAETRVSYFLVNYLLFNTPHVILTFFMLGMFPEYRAAYQQTELGERRALWFRLMVGFFLIPFLFASLLWRLPVAADTLAKGLLVLFPAFHGLRQILGLSVLYNQVLETRRGTIFGPRFEKFCFHLLILMSGLMYLLVWGDQITVPSAVRTGLIAAHFGVVVAVLINSFFMHPAGHRLTKMLFDLRLFLFPLTDLTGVAALGTTGIHGVEYWFIWRKMSVNSQYNRDQKGRWLLASLIAIISLLGLFGFTRRHFPDFVASLDGLGQMLFWTFAFGAFASTYAHYFLDGEMFRMRNVALRRNVAPLLVPPRGNLAPHLVK